jgi:hypothetical protein
VEKRACVLHLDSLDGGFEAAAGPQSAPRMPWAPRPGPFAKGPSLAGPVLWLPPHFWLPIRVRAQAQSA